MSDNSPWARDDYNRAAQRGRSRRAEGRCWATDWSATLTYSYQRQSTLGAWDQDPALAPRTVQRFGPESHDLRGQDTRLPRGRRRRHRRSGVRQHLLVAPDAPAERVLAVHGELRPAASGFTAGRKDSPACDDPVYGSGATSGCNVPLQFYEYHTNPERWSDELRLASKPGGRFHWLGGLYWEKTTDKNSGSTYYMPGRSSRAPHSSTTTPLQHAARLELAAAWHLIRLHDAQRLPADHRVREHQLRYHRQAERRGGRGALPLRLHLLLAPMRSSRTHRRRPSLEAGSSHKWNSKFGINYKLTDHVDGVRRLRPGLPRRRQQLGLLRPVLRQRRAEKLCARHAQQLRARLEDHQSQRPPAVERRGLPHGLEEAADASSTTSTSVPRAASTSTSAMRASTASSPTSTSR